MVASLVLVWPSAHIGSELHIRQADTLQTFASQHLQAQALSWCAFYADCRHEVKPVEEGWRVVLTFDLVLPTDAAQVPDAAHPALVRALRDLFFPGGSDRFGAAEARSERAILELTATPVPKKINVLYSVSARELQAGDMIKLPMMLAEHKAWPDAVRDAVLRRRHLEAEAAHEDRYVRPIVLFQAQDKTDVVPPERLRQYLLDEKLAADEGEIVIAIGEQRGLDGLDLFDTACRVRYVITVEALKEGWDCSFAYVLCSLQNVRSGKDVEQLLGRVLRMPYAARRKSPALNRAYAHVVARSFSEAASALVDRMVQGMGFEALSAATAVLPDPGLPGLFDDDAPLPPPRPTLTLVLPPAAAVALQAEPDLQVTLTGPTDSGGGEAAAGEVPAAATAQTADEVSDALLARVLARVLAVLPAAEHAAVTDRVRQHNQRIVAACARPPSVAWPLRRCRACVWVRASANRAACRPSCTCSSATRSTRSSLSTCCAPTRGGRWKASGSLSSATCSRSTSTSSGWSCARRAMRPSCRSTPCPPTPTKPTSCCG